ncbi:putative alpha/beta hydrolase [Bernardetia litoralis DSM 6794]|uniref:Putative alpha/beta hydrolase n=1 Tax=Bernardetia litoralis (strain ATCC 23117 / DSM 6794 / NBRC 15988 / NCIMB 1366 / Fx l1 / Sio-4) TaxID=880071 RepID=I4AP26_BERLS|nr:alpha/beta hydrolase [Bernardetia litoralis]AFM05711.1 putative alpha/beta hydrolase [Bernardetia litoralis DSM 6794]
MQSVDISRETIKGFGDEILSATFYKIGDMKPKGIIIINPATAVKQNLYASFAKFIALQNYLVVTFDYQGIGLSRSKKITDYKTTLHQYSQDAKAVFDYLITKYKQNIFIIGHSVGGSFIGFSESNTNPRLIGAYCICMQSGYKGYAPSKSLKRKLNILYYGIIPILTTLKGYLPAKSLKLGEDLPKEVAREFAQWGNNKRYNLDFIEQNPVYNYFESLSFPMYLVNFSDDEWSTQNSIDDIANLYSNCHIEREYINPKELGIKKVGHMGFFNIRCKQSLWVSSLSWINQIFDKNLIK